MKQLIALQFHQAHFECRITHHIHVWWCSLTYCSTHDVCFGDLWRSWLHWWYGLTRVVWLVYGLNIIHWCLHKTSKVAQLQPVQSYRSWTPLTSFNSSILIRVKNRFIVSSKLINMYATVAVLEQQNSTKSFPNFLLLKRFPMTAYPVWPTNIIKPVEREQISFLEINYFQIKDVSHLIFFDFIQILCW